jgi:hypothetical protein
VILFHELIILIVQTRDYWIIDLIIWSGHSTFQIQILRVYFETLCIAKKKGNSLMFWSYIANINICKYKNNSIICTGTASINLMFQNFIEHISICKYKNNSIIFTGTDSNPQWTPMIFIFVWLSPTLNCGSSVRPIAYVWSDVTLGLD